VHLYHDHSVLGSTSTHIGSEGLVTFGVMFFLMKVSNLLRWPILLACLTFWLYFDSLMLSPHYKGFGNAMSPIIFCQFGSK
jgi:hypothetical protein